MKTLEVTHNSHHPEIVTINIFVNKLPGLYFRIHTPAARAGSVSLCPCSNVAKYQMKRP